MCVFSRSGFISYQTCKNTFNLKQRAAVRTHRHTSASRSRYWDHDPALCSDWSVCPQHAWWGFTDLVEDGQVLALQRSGLLSEAWKGNKTTGMLQSRQDTTTTTTTTEISYVFPLWMPPNPRSSRSLVNDQLDVFKNAMKVDQPHLRCKNNLFNFIEATYTPISDEQLLHN